MALLALLALLPWAAHADTYWVNGNVNASAKFAPLGQPFVFSNNLDQFAVIDSPQTLLPNALDKTSAVSQGGSTARVLASIGSLKAFSSANYGLGFNPQNNTIQFTGDAFGIATATFVDRVVVSGAGLPLGTPVSYRIDFSIDGQVSTPSFEAGGNLTANAEAKAGLNWMGTGQAVNLNWKSNLQPTGFYSLTLNTVVGATLEISGTLTTTASVGWQNLTARTAVADFYHSALYTLTPSVAGLNTTGVSGHNFLAPVPESSTAGLMALGLAAFGLARRRFVREGAR